MYICNVCGFDELEEPLYYEDGAPTFMICACCGFESGVADLDQGYSFESYRKKWLEKGTKWLLEDKKPKDWDLKTQLKRIGVEI
ncbi:MAG: hypothetical protein PHO80_01995 [Candidatus Gracilibacteria bacterium]|nr:hypothetical protein [Candidatus Gracilibacteria bacterium]MDD4530303.1 hypothetical protein [Candidatus Gracilibacteria bacterium]